MGVHRHARGTLQAAIPRYGGGSGKNFSPSAHFAIPVAASCSYLTPLEPSSLMVYGPGKYRFMDFVKVGFPLTFLIYAIAIVLVPMVWPVRG